MNIKEIIYNLQNQLYKDDEFSLPYIVDHEGKEKICFFIYNCDFDDEGNLTIFNISNLFIFNLEENQFLNVENVSNFEYPIIINFENFYDVDELNELYNSYYNSIDLFIKEEFNPISYKKIFEKIVSNKFTDIYKKLGAKYL